MSDRRQLHQNALAERLGALQVAAEKLAASVDTGDHAQSRAGQGREFWQYRPAEAGVASEDIDWRRSAKHDELYVREVEAETRHCLTVWCDTRAQMFASPHPRPKVDDALVLAGAAAIAAHAAHEQTRLLGRHREESPRDLAQLAAAGGAWGEDDRSPVNAHLLIVSDFYEPHEVWAGRLRAINSTRRRGTLLVVRAREETDFTFHGRTRFRDPGHPDAFLEAARADRWMSGFQARLRDHDMALSELAHTMGWSMLRHVTDRPLTAIYGQLHAILGEVRR